MSRLLVRPSVPDSNGAPHAAMPPSHHQSNTGNGVIGIRVCLCVCVCMCVGVCVSHGHPLDRPPAVCATASPFFFSPFCCQRE